MKSAQNAQSVKIKLTKKQSPCLTFEITLVSENTLSVPLSRKKESLHVRYSTLIIINTAPAMNFMRLML